MTETRGRQVRVALTERLPDWGVLVLESHHAPDFSMQPRVHDFAKIVYIMEGSGQFQVGVNRWTFAAGDVILVPPRTHNQIIDDPGNPTSLYVGCIADRVLLCEPKAAASLTAIHERGPNRRTTTIAATLRRMIFNQDRGGPSCGVEMLIDAWRLIRCVLPSVNVKRNTTPSIEETSEIDAYIRDLQHQFLEATTIDAAADSLGMSRRAFTQRFRDATGTTWLQYVRQLSIQHAAQLLRCSDLPVASVAFESGFADLSTFYRRFAKQHGMTPLQYRQRAT